MGLKAVDDLPEFVRFSLSGLLGTLLDYLAYKVIYDSGVFTIFRATLSWATAYALSVIWQHALHAFFVFGGFGHMGYFKSLLTMYIAYSGSIVFSPAINWVLVEYARFEHQQSFAATLMITGLANYVFLSRSMGASSSSPALVILSGGIPLSEVLSQRKGPTLPRHESTDRVSAGKSHTTVVIGANQGKSGCSVS
eukprot:TRINITY_DN12179_c0_g1_i1.p1 TRINITY_DN12179_c0_g1~~TRINITY_DN12179_c0_g1_i1.p1  ORF type:complete len:195 (+),score=9.72 TRINITY_DN12179_c0_g1_i1:167-751(+)